VGQARASRARGAKATPNATTCPSPQFAVAHSSHHHAAARRLRPRPVSFASRETCPFSFSGPYPCPFGGLPIFLSRNITHVLLEACPLSVLTLELKLQPHRPDCVLALPNPI
jgi:hypothetical protein